MQHTEIKRCRVSMTAAGVQRARQLENLKEFCGVEKIYCNSIVPRDTRIPQSPQVGQRPSSHTFSSGLFSVRVSKLAGVH
jgi:hypothetical protein